MDASTIIQKDETIDVFALAHKHLEERRDLDDEQDKRWITDERRKINDESFEKEGKNFII